MTTGGNIGSCNGLLSDGIKPLPELMFNLSSEKSNDNNLRAISQETPQPIFFKFSLKINCLTFQLNISGAN